MTTTKPLTMELAGGQFTTMSGDQVELVVCFQTKFGGLRSKLTFLVFETCGENLSIGITSVKALLGQPGIAELFFSPNTDELISPEETQFSADVQLYPDMLRLMLKTFILTSHFQNKQH